MKIKFFAVAALSCAMLSSCYCDKLVVGNVGANEELVHVESVRNPHVLGGLIVNHDKASRHMEGIDNYVVEHKMTFGDVILSGVTLGIYTPSTTKYYVPKSNPKVVVEKQKFKSKAYKGHLK